MILLVCSLLAIVASGWATEDPVLFAAIGDDTQTTNGSLGIIGGTNAEEGDVPWQVSFQYWNGRAWSHFCGGSIMSPNRIATAAHCCKAVEGYPTRVLAGALNKGRSEPSQQSARVARMVSHPQYDRRTIQYDACKLYLSSCLQLNGRTVNSIKLCTTEPRAYSTCLISGWGSVDPSGRSGTDQLQKLYQLVTPRDTCARNYGRSSLHSSMICVGGNQGQGGCKGDSGGPMVCNTHEGMCLAGATSWGSVPCGQENRPTVYANTASLYSFFST